MTRVALLAERVLSVALVVYAIACAVVVGAGGSVLGGALRIAGVGIVVCLVGVVWRRLPDIGCVAAIGLGTIGLTVGEALGYGRRPGLDPSVRSISASILLAASTAVVLTAIVVLLTPRPTWTQRVTSAVVLAVGLVAAHRLMIDPVGEAMRMTNVVRVDVNATTPADLGLTYEDVTFPAVDGTKLSGWYLPSQNGAAVVLAHGSSSSRSSVLDYADVLGRNGYGVLMFDSRGQGRSDGRAMDLGWDGNDDLEGAVTFVVAQDGVDPSKVAAVGVSLGGEEALGAAADDDRIAAVVADGAMYRRLGDWTPHHDDGLAGEIIDGVMFTTADMLTDAAPPIKLADAVRLIAPPVMLIASNAENEIRDGTPVQGRGTRHGGVVGGPRRGARRRVERASSRVEGPRDRIPRPRAES